MPDHPCLDAVPAPRFLPESIPVWALSTVVAEPVLAQQPISLTACGADTASRPPLAGHKILLTLPMITTEGLRQLFRTARFLLSLSSDSKRARPVPVAWSCNCLGTRLICTVVEEAVMATGLHGEATAGLCPTMVTVVARLWAVPEAALLLLLNPAANSAAMDVRFCTLVSLILVSSDLVSAIG